MMEFGHPDGIQVMRDRFNGDVVIEFQRDDAESVLVRMEPSTLPTFVALLHEKLEGQTVTPISLPQLRPGKMIAVSAISAKKQPNGDLGLTLTADFEDRVVQIPLSLSSRDLMLILKEMGWSQS